MIWRVCNNVILVNWLLWRRKILDSPVCVKCDAGIESVEHMLLECEWTRVMWFVCCNGLRIRKERVTKFDVWWLNSIEVLKKNGKEVMMNDVVYVCWQIWKIRCEMVLERKQISIDEAIRRKKVAIKEFYSLKWNLNISYR